MAESEESDRKMELIFDDNSSRSKAFLQLLAIRGEGVANDDLVFKLSLELQEKTNPEKVNW